MHSLTLAVVSDLHIGEGSRARDFSPSGNCRGLDVDFFETFKSFIRQQQIRADYLVVSGDTVHGGRPAEFQLAKQILARMLDVLRVPQRNLLLVPGNHDINWQVMKIEDTTGFWARQKYSPMLDNEVGLGGMLKRTKNRLFTSPFFCLHEDKNILAVLLNSCAHDGPDAPIHHGVAWQQALDELDVVLQTKLPSSDGIRLFVTHHHPKIYSDPVPDLPDFSAMTNAENLCGLLRRHSFDMVVHGHKHSPRFLLDYDSNQVPLAFLCAGSFSAELDSRWRGSVTNQFHLVNFLHRDPKLGCLKGHVKSWSYATGHGWKASTARDGISHMSAFGALLQPTQLRECLRSVISNGLQPGGHLQWTAFVKHEAELSYVPFDSVILQLEALRQTESFEYQGDTPDTLILYKD